MSPSLDIAAASAYSRAHGLDAFILARNDDVLAEHYGDGFGPNTPHALYSGAKSFWGVAAAYASAEGLLDLDERVADTFAGWNGDPWKRRVTLRMLLSLTAGFGFGGLGASVPSYERALATALKNEPGSRFTYGGIPLQVFGAVFVRKLETLGLTPHAYLHRRVLDAAGARVSRWRTLPDTTQPLPTGAFLTSHDWLAYGRFVLRERATLAPCFQGSTANPRYGLGWWLGARGAPADLFYASGSAGQALYVVPTLGLAIARFGSSASYRHEAFLKRLFA